MWTALPQVLIIFTLRLNSLRIGLPPSNVSILKKISISPNIQISVDSLQSFCLFCRLSKVGKGPLWLGPSLPFARITVHSFPRCPSQSQMTFKCFPTFTSLVWCRLFLLLQMPFYQPHPPICVLDSYSSFNTPLKDLLFCKILSNLSNPCWSFFCCAASLTNTYFCYFTLQAMWQLRISLIHIVNSSKTGTVF